MHNITKIIIDKAAYDEPYTQNVLKRLSDLPMEIVNDTRAVFDQINQTDDPITEGKKIIVLEKNKGSFLKKCPGTKEYICCGYQILNFSTQCNLECAYCILQAYFNNPAIRIFVNLDDMFAELQEKIDSNKNRRWRIGTGEFTDSLSLEQITGFSEYVIPFFIARKNTILELKTKTTNIDFLDRFDPQGRIMLSWSLNSPHIQKTEEVATESIERRLHAARKAQTAGYLVSFHFDPIIYDVNWEKEYKQAITLLFDHIDPNKISWISMGCFRYMPPLKDIIKKRFPQSRLFLGEFIRGLDGKMRYPKPLRINIYKKMAEMLRHATFNFKLYLCMESDEVWQNALGFSPKNSERLINYLDEAVF
ncbi:radical SAM protein [Candidatus Omnitrophota bacterium]